MQWSLFLLILMVQRSIFACHHYEYHFIDKPMSWKDAQKYCRQMFTDLATVYNMKDMDRLSNFMNTSEAWIGLYSNSGQLNRQWHWSLPGVEFNEKKWHQNEPNDHNGVENCVVMVNNEWKDYSCKCKRRFICYDEKTEKGKSFIFIDQLKTWPEAQKYCRQHHTDLVSGLRQLRQGELMAEASRFQGHLWIGLFRDTWRWSDNSSSSFRKWRLNVFDDKGKKECAVLQESRDWSSADCGIRKPFFCYDDKVILIKENMKWTEALNYCRENYHDLVSITNPHQQILVQARAKNADTNFVWVGLLYSCPLDLWFWVNDELLCYENFAPNGKEEQCYNSVAMQKGKKHKWFSKDENNTFNFICAI